MFTLYVPHCFVCFFREVFFLNLFAFELHLSLFRFHTVTFSCLCTQNVYIHFLARNPCIGLSQSIYKPYVKINYLGMILFYTNLKVLTFKFVKLKSIKILFSIFEQNLNRNTLHCRFNQFTIYRSILHS